MKSVLQALIPLSLLLSAGLSQAGDKVLASLHPLGLVAASVTPAEDLSVLVPPGMTPHDFSLRPSDIRKIRAARIIFWGGEDAEPYLKEFAQRWPDKHWIDVSHFAEAEHEHSHGHEDHHDGSAADDDHRQADAFLHHDPHWWLAPEVMVAAQAELAAVLQSGTKQSGQPFARAVAKQLEKSRLQLAGVREQAFFVFHRAYDHWVEAMQLNQAGAFTLSPKRKPGMKTLQSMREQLQRGDIKCVFSEPEFSPALLDSVVRGLDVKRGELDPMAAGIAISRDGYVRYLQYLTDQFHQCLS